MKLLLLLSFFAFYSITSAMAAGDTDSIKKTKNGLKIRFLYDHPQGNFILPKKLKWNVKQECIVTDKGETKLNITVQNKMVHPYDEKQLTYVSSPSVKLYSFKDKDLCGGQNYDVVTINGRYSKRVSNY